MKNKLVLTLSLCLAFSLSIFAQKKDNERAEFTVVSQVREVSAFQSLDITGRFLVKLYQSAQPELSVITADKYIPNVETKVESNVLNIKMIDKSGEEKSGVLDGLKTKYNDYLIRQPIEIHIGVTNINIINLAGVTTLETDGKLNLNTLYMSIGDASKATMNLEISKELNVSLTGATKLDVVGSAVKFEVGVHGASALDAKDLKTKSAKVELTGAARAEVQASDALDADLKGATKLVCTGSPKSVKQTISRASSITIK